LSLQSPEIQHFHHRKQSLQSGKRHHHQHHRRRRHFSTSVAAPSELVAESLMLRSRGLQAARFQCANSAVFFSHVKLLCVPPRLGDRPSRPSLTRVAKPSENNITMPPKAGKTDTKAAAEPKAKDPLSFLNEREQKVLAQCLLTADAFPDVSPRCFLRQSADNPPFPPISSQILPVGTGGEIGPRLNHPSHPNPNSPDKPSLRLSQKQPPTLTSPAIQGIQIDAKKAANRLGLASGSVTNAWSALKKKFAAEKLAAGYVTAPADDNNNDHNESAAAEDPNPAPKKRARTSKAAAAATGGGDGGGDAAAAKPKRAPRAKKAAAVRGRVPVNPESIVAPVDAPVVAGQEEASRVEEGGAEEEDGGKQDEGDTTVDENGAESGEAGEI
jgi:hypothetical protein